MPLARNLSIMLRRANHVPLWRELPLGSNQKHFLRRNKDSDSNQRHLSTTPYLREVFKSRYEHNFSTDMDFFSFMAKDVGSVSDKTAVICAASGRSLTYRQLFDRAEQIGRNLQRRGYRRGDMAAIFSPNIPEYILTILGCAYAGMSVTLVNPLYQTSEVEAQLRDTNTVVLLAFASFAKTALAAKRAVPNVREIFVYGFPLKFTKMNSMIDLYVRLFHGETGCFLFDKLQTLERRKRRSEAPWSADEVSFQPDEDLLLLPYSSGTSGVPKPACHTHSTIIAYIEQIQHFPSISKNQGSVFLLVLPMFHIFGCLSPFGFLKLQGTIVTNPLFQKTMFLKSIHDYKINCISVVPPLVNFMATDPDASSMEKYDVSSIKAIHSGGATLSSELGRNFQAKFPFVEVLQGYGMTEGFISTADEFETPYESVGRMGANIELRVIDSETREECARNKPGEFMVKTASAFKGYYKNPKATEETFHLDERGDKWLLTGDIGYIDDDDNLFLIDRVKELLKYKGHQVSPVEVEECLLSLEGVAEAGVAGVPHDSFGEVPMAFLVLKKGSNLTKDEIHAHVNERLAFQNHLKGGIVFLDEMPKSRIGKILRGQLRTLVKEKMASGEIQRQK